MTEMIFAQLPVFAIAKMMRSKSRSVVAQDLRCFVKCLINFMQKLQLFRLRFIQYLHLFLLHQINLLVEASHL